MDRASEAALLRSASRLIGLLEKETRLLLAMHPRDIEGLQVEKAALVADYQAALTALADPNGSLEHLSPAIRQELAATAATLETAIAANQRALTAAKLATDQLVQSIAAAVVEEQRIQDQYHADGRNGLGPAPGSPVSVSINEVL